MLGEFANEYDDAVTNTLEETLTRVAVVSKYLF